MAEEKRFTAVIALSDSYLGEDHSDPIALYAFIERAYADESSYVYEKYANDPKTRESYGKNHIWKGFYTLNNTKEFFELLEEFEFSEVSPDKVLIMVGDLAEFRFIGEVISFTQRLERYIRLGVNVLIITDREGYGNIEMSYDNVREFVLDPKMVRASLKSSNDGWTESAKEFGRFINENF